MDVLLHDLIECLWV